MNQYDGFFSDSVSKNVVIIGASGGVGFAVTRRLLVKGCRVSATRRTHKIPDVQALMCQYARQLSLRRMNPQSHNFPRP